MVRRLDAPLLRMAPSGRGRGIHMGSGARRERSSQALRFGAARRAACERHLGSRASPRALCGRRRHRRRRHGRRSAAPDHAHDRRRIESPVGAARDGGHLHARQQPLHRAARCWCCGSGRSADRRSASETRAARERQSEVRQIRRRATLRAHSCRGAKKAAGRGEEESARPAEVRAPRTSDRRRSSAAAGRQARVPAGGREGRSRQARRSTELRDRIRVRRADHRPDPGRRCSRQAAACSPQPRDRYIAIRRCHVRCRARRAVEYAPAGRRGRACGCRRSCDRQQRSVAGGHRSRNGQDTRHRRPARRCLDPRRRHAGRR